MSLYHYTCEHGRAGIGDVGRLLASVDLSEKSAAMAKTDPGLRDLLSWVWLTDLEAPDRDGLGLTMRLSKCDRTVHRYQVIDPGPGVARWTAVRRAFNPDLRAELEGAPGAMPMHWFVARSGVVTVAYYPLARATALGQ